MADGMQSETGYHFELDGQDLVVFSDDAKLVGPRNPCLELTPRIDLVNPSSICELQKWLCTADPPSPIKMPTQARTLGGNGILSTLEAAAKTFFLCNSSQFEQVYNDFLRPLVQECGLTGGRFAPVRYKQFYGNIAMAKITWLIDHLGIEETQRRIAGGVIMGGVLPNVFDPQDLLSTYLCFRPYTAALALPQPGQSFILTGSTIKAWPHQFFQGLPSYTSDLSEHLSLKDVLTSFPGLHSPTERDDFTEMAANSVNTFWDFFLNPGNWLNELGESDQLKQIKALGLAKLLMSDVQAIERSASVYGRTRLTFEFTDKFASLLVELADGVSPKKRSQLEADLAAALMRPDITRIAARLFYWHSSNQKSKIYKRLGKYVDDVVNSASEGYRAIHREASLPTTNESIDKCIRTLRNLAHGTFLNNGKFESLFVSIDATVPPKMDRLPWIYLLCLGVDPSHLITSVLRQVGLPPSPSMEEKRGAERLS